MGAQTDMVPAVLDGEDDAPARRRWRPRRMSPAGLLGLLLAVVVGILVLPPILAVIYSGFHQGRTLLTGFTTLDNYARLLVDPNTYATLKDTAVFAVGASVLAVTVAGLLAWLVERTNAPFRKLVYLAIIVAFGVPTVIQTMGWILLLGPRNGLVNVVLRTLFGEGALTVPLHTMPSMIFIETAVIFPLVFLLLVPAFRAADPALEEAAQMCGANRLRTIRLVSLPLVTPALLGALFLALIVTVQSFEVPALIGTPAGKIVLSTEIYGRVRRMRPDFGAAGSFSTIMMVLAVFGLYLYQRVTARAHRFITVTGKGYRPQRLDLGRWRWLAAVATIGMPAIIVAPIAILAWAAFLRTYTPPSLSALLNETTLDTFRGVIGHPGVTSAAWNSFVLGIGSAVIVMSITILAAWLVLRRRNTVSRGIDFLVTLPLVVPGLVLGLAILRTYVVAPVPVYGTLLVILIAYVVNYLPFGMRFSHAGLISLHPELEEAAAVSGANLGVALRRVVAPLLVPTIMAGGLFVFLATVRQLSLVVFLSGPGNQVVANEMFQMWTVGNLTDVAAFSMLVVLAVVVLAAVLYRMSGVGGIAPSALPGADGKGTG